MRDFASNRPLIHHLKRCVSAFTLHRLLAELLPKLTKGVMAPPGGRLDDPSLQRGGISCNSTCHPLR